MRAGVMLDRFSRHQLALNRAKTTVEWYRFLLERFFLFVKEQGVKELGGIDGRLLLRYQHHVAELRNGKGRAYQAGTQNLHVIAVRELFRYLRRAGDVAVDPTADTELAKLPTRLPAGMLGVEEMARLIEQPDTGSPLGIRDRAVMELLYSAGMRRNELLNLDINDISLDAETILIRQGKGSKDRVVPLGKMARRWVEAYLKVRPLLKNGDPTEALLLSYRGHRMDKTTIKRAVTACALRAGIARPVTPHCFRHSCATHLLDAGANVVHLQRLLGHARLDTTTRYLQVSITNLKQVHARYHPREKTG